MFTDPLIGSTGSMLCVLGLVGIVGTSLLRVAIEGYFRVRIGELTEAAEQLAADRKRMMARIEAVANEALDRQDEIKRTKRKTARAQLAIQELRQRGEIVAHLVGDRTAGARLFTCDVTFDRDRSRKGLRGMLALPILWDYPNIAEVWATDEGEAARTVEAAFPRQSGFWLSPFAQGRKDADA